jgi:hypothetical protein
MTITQRVAAVFAAFLVPLAFFLVGAVGLGGPPLAIAAIVALLLLSRAVPRFWRTAGTGALAGLVAGILVLGPGFRLAMRVVAILDPVRIPEFTLDGTFFIMMFVGGIMGLLGGVSYAFLDLGLRVPRVVKSFLVAIFIMGLLLSNDGLRQELLELGAGAWVNIPMFGLASFLYASATGWFVARLQRRWGRTASAETLKVPA